MPDPLSLVALGAAIGGGAGKFVEKAWDSGEKWIVSYFANHQEKAREKAEAVRRHRKLMRKRLQREGF